MSFMQPWILLALPLIAIPILIHLMNQRRFQTMEWGAMYFLQAANRMSRGFARIRRWLILAARTLVIAGIVFAVARPLASGWLGLAVGNRTDTTIVILDRSPSMAAMDEQRSMSKLATGKSQLAEAFQKLKSDHWVLIDSVTGKPTELEKPEDLLSSVNVDPAGASADLPALLESAHRYAKSNQTGRTDIWICSDSRTNDWDAEGGRWAAVRDSFLELPQSIRFYLLNFSDLPDDNRSIRVSSVRRVEEDDGAYLLLSLEVSRGPNQKNETIPVDINIDGARSVMNVELSGPKFQLTEHKIPINLRQVRGWGRVALPADSVDSDNEFFFVYDRQPTRKTLIVAEDTSSTRAIELAAGIPADPNTQTLVETIQPDQLSAVDWNEIGLLVWHSQFPDQSQEQLLRSFVDEDGQLLFLPPGGRGLSASSASSGSSFGLSWGDWKKVADDTVVSNWRGDSGLLANTMDGSALPVGELAVKKVRAVSGDFVTLASLSSEDPLLVQVPTDRGAVHALATTANTEDSSLAANGVVAYVMIQRALQTGSQRLAGAKQATAGTGNYDSGDWRQLAGNREALSHQLAWHGGVYQQGDSESGSPQLFAFNRSSAEDVETVLKPDQIESCFQGLNVVQVAEESGKASSLIREVWRLFLIAMLIAMVAESALCMPRQRVSEVNEGEAGRMSEGALA